MSLCRKCEPGFIESCNEESMVLVTPKLKAARKEVSFMFPPKYFSMVSIPQNCVKVASLQKEQHFFFAKRTRVRFRQIIERKSLVVIRL